MAYRIIELFVGIILVIGFLSCEKPQSYQDSQTIQFVSQTNDIITIKPEAESVHNIYYNNSLIFSDSTHYFIYPNSLNRIIEGEKGIALFLLVDDRPSFDKIVGFQITNHSAILKAETCFYGEGGRKNGPAPFTDMDGDGLLEFGGFDITERPNSYPDSIYYLPSTFYEIKDGEIFFDKELTIKKDIEENGLYLEHPEDSQGFCCVIIPNPTKK